MLAGEALETGIEFLGIVFGELGDRADAEEVEIAFDGRADGNEVLKAARLSHGSPFRISLYFRHRRKQNIAHFRYSAQADFEAMLERVARRERKRGQGHWIVRAHPSQKTRRMGHPQVHGVDGVRRKATAN